MDVDWENIEGSPFPLGVSWIEDEHAFNFSIYSKHAESVELRFYGEDDFEHPFYQFRFDCLKNKSGPVWHCRLPSETLANCRFYCYSISGPGLEPGFS